MATPRDDASPSSRYSLQRVIRLTLMVTVGAFVAMTIYGAWASEGSALGAALGVALVAAGAMAFGGVIGFLFGVPSCVADPGQRRDRPPVPAPVPAVAGATSGDAASTERCGPNQLVQVAEWLTRILIGATVTQLGAVRDLIQSLGEQSSVNILGSFDGTVVITAAIVYAAVFGFFVGHLCTRLILNVLFNDVERATSLGALRSSLGTDNPPANAGKSFDGISSTVAELVVARDVSDLSDPEDVRAWGLARLKTANRDQGAVSAAVSALTRSFVARPNDRAAVESLVLGLLYQDGGYDRAIDEARRFLADDASAPATNANLHAYLACAYGQRYAATPATHADVRAAAATGAIDAARQAVALDAGWAAYLRRIASAPPGAVDDDLTALAKDSAELRRVLGLDGAPGGPAA